jgi:hypothetical protein
MGGAQAVRLARGVKRIAETDEAGDHAVPVKSVGDHGRDPPAHGLAADDQPLAWPGGLPHHLPIDRAQDLGPRRRAAAARLPACGHVGKLEAQDADVMGSDQAGDRLHERAVHGCTGAMGKQQGGPGIIGAVGQEYGHAAFRGFDTNM